MKHYSTLLAAAAMLVLLGAASAPADDYNSGAATKDDLGVTGPHDDLTPGTPQGINQPAPGSAEDFDATDTAPPDKFGEPPKMDKGPIDIEGDAEANADTIVSPLHQRNLQEALNPGNARHRSRTSAGSATEKKSEAPRPQMDEGASVGDMND
jgi:hypothetical protein